MKAAKTESVNTFDGAMNYFTGGGPPTHLQPSHGPPMHATRTHASSNEMSSIFQMCRADDWHGVLNCVRENPSVALTPMIMDNHICTTIIHQAITSKGDTSVRAEVISTILRITPQAASIKNGYGSLPLHVIAQRNTKIDAQTKERLIFELVNSYKGALLEEGGVGKRTPLHIIFTDYISPRLTRMMIDNGHQACFMKDKKGYLPAHVACSRHCSPKKLRMLLEVYPGSLHEATNDGKTLLDLAKETATKSHPNYALIEELNYQLGKSSQIGRVSSEEDDSMSIRSRLNSNDSAKSWYTGESSYATTMTTNSPPHPHPHNINNSGSPPYMKTMTTDRSPPHRYQQGNNMAMMNSPHHPHHPHHHHPYMQTMTTTTNSPAVSMMDLPMPTPTPEKRVSRKRKTMQHQEDPAADLLLHFSRQPPTRSSSSRRNDNTNYTTHQQVLPPHHFDFPAAAAQHCNLEESSPSRIEQV